MPSGSASANAIIRNATGTLVTHYFVSDKDTPSDSSKVGGPQWNDRHIITNSRLPFSDMCDTSSLPSGASTTGDIAFSATRLRRELGGTQSSTYVTPSFPLNGPYMIEVTYENLNSYTTGELNFYLYRDTGSAIYCRVASQTDGNKVVYIDGGPPASTARSASGTSTASGTYQRDDPENSYRATIYVNEQKLIVGTIGHSPTAGVMHTGQNSGRIGQAGAGFVHTGTLNAGDNVHFEISAATTRKIGIYLVRVWRGAIAPL